MSVEQSISSERPKVAEVVPHGILNHVWIRKNIVQDTSDNGPDGTPTEFWKCTELHFVTDGSITEKYAEEHIDELWGLHERDGMTLEERMAELEAKSSDQEAALLELGDMVAGE